MAIPIEPCSSQRALVVAIEVRADHLKALLLECRVDCAEAALGSGLCEHIDVGGGPHVAHAVLDGVELHHQPSDQHPLSREMRDEIGHGFPEADGLWIIQVDVDLDHCCRARSASRLARGVSVSSRPSRDAGRGGRSSSSTRRTRIGPPVLGVRACSLTIAARCRVGAYPSTPGLLPRSPTTSPAESPVASMWPRARSRLSSEGWPSSSSPPARSRSCGA